MKTPRFKLWTPEEDAILEKYWEAERTKVAARLPDRNGESVRRRAHVLGISKMQGDTRTLKRRQQDVSDAMRLAVHQPWRQA